MADKPLSTTTLSSQRKGKRWNELKNTLLEVVADLYCATPRDLARYIRGRVPTVNDTRTVNACIKSLGEHYEKHNFFNRYCFFSGTYLYGLSEFGARFARQQRGILTAREFDVKDIEHEHIITSLHIQLIELCKKHGWTLKWIQDTATYKRHINPDAIATLTTPKGSFVFCLEPERQAFNDGFLKKGKKYFDTYGTPEAKKLFGAEKFRVIFVALTEKRMNTILERFEDEFHYRMFWITTVDKFEKHVGGDIFKTPKDHKSGAYSFLDILK